MISDETKATPFGADRAALKLMLQRGEEIERARLAALPIVEPEPPPEPEHPYGRPVQLDPIDEAEIVNAAYDLIMAKMVRADVAIDAAALDVATDEALDNDPGDLFPDAPEPEPDPIDLARQINARLLHKDDDLPPQAPSDWDMDGQGVVEAMPAVSNVPPEIAALLDDGETLTRDVRRKLTERLNVELAELKNLRGLAGEDLKREAEIEKLLGLFARLGEI